MSERKRILVAEDDKATREHLREILSSWNYETSIAEDGDKAAELLLTFQPDVLLADLRMPRRNGLDLLRQIRESQLETLSIIISGAGEIPDAVQAIKLGAADYIRKPIDPDELQRVLKTLTDHIEVREENRRLRRRLAEVGELGQLFGKSLSMRRVLVTVERLADSAASVIITGESGTGKEVAARTIHQLSSRKNGPFVGINCAAIPSTLMESELFGHERGAFTGADRRREGCFELANHGTLLLDEITEMKPELQAKLLRVIEERRLRRLGGSAEIELDVRVLAASNRNLAQAVRNGTFREDLYYRLNVFTIEMPRLCERGDDIPLLCELFVQQFAELNHKNIAGIDDDALSALQTHPWPGNVRQLRNVIERASVLCTGPMIGIRDLPAEFKASPQVESATFQVRLGTSLDDVERELISRTIDFAGGNKTLAAELLGVATKTLYNKLERYTADRTKQAPPSE
jgi:DNA-binding NtrC family response regulator